MSQLSLGLGTGMRRRYLAAPDADALTWYNAVIAAGSTVNTNNRIAQNTLIKGLKADGVWSAIAELYLYAGPSSLSGALVKAKGSGAVTNVNFVGGDHSQTFGLKGNATTKYISSIAANTLSNNSNHIFVSGDQMETTGDIKAAGSYNGAGANLITLEIANPISGAGYRSGTVTAGEYPFTTPQTSGSYCGTRTAAAAAKIYKNGSPAASNATSIPTALSTRPIFIFALNNVGTASSLSSARLSVVSLGDGLSDAQSLALHSRVATYVASLT